MRDKSKKRQHPLYRTDDQFKNAKLKIEGDEGWDEVLGRRRSFAGVMGKFSDKVEDGSITSAMFRKMKGGK